MTRESTGASCIGQALECSVPPLGSGRGRTPEQGSNAVDYSAESSQLGLADGNLGKAGEHEGQLAAINARRIPPHTGRPWRIASAWESCAPTTVKAAAVSRNALTGSPHPGGRPRARRGGDPGGCTIWAGSRIIPSSLQSRHPPPRGKRRLVRPRPSVRSKQPWAAIALSETRMPCRSAATIAGILRT